MPAEVDAINTDTGTIRKKQKGEIFVKKTNIIDIHHNIEVLKATGPQDSGLTF